MPLDVYKRELKEHFLNINEDLVGPYQYFACLQKTEKQTFLSYQKIFGRTISMPLIVC